MSENQQDPGTAQEQPAIMQALAARGVVREWVKGAQTLAVVSAARRMGWLDRLREPVTEQVLTGGSWTPARVRGVLDVLAEAGVATAGPDGWRLTPPFTVLLDGASGVQLDVVLDAARLDLDALAHLDRPGASMMDGEGALIVARDSGVTAGPVTRTLYRSVYDAMPEVSAALTDGGPMLDLGSGIGGALLTTAQLFPGLKLVGVDLVPEVVAELARRRDALDLAGQVEVRCLDARDLPDRGTFRVAYWAQGFFTDDARAGTLAVLRRALAGDGLLVLQEQPSTAADAVRQGQHGIGAGRTAAELAAEAREAGFVLVRQVRTGLGNLVVVRNQP
ncbi:class I SAM-dependent methyltransferase [Kineosporia sp. J2-2]|uniref:Class I SAM-dependent methyltransferase n=1 Tax=Kineosporia corallincola TaxID=2835133 RepID=A0ABS5TK50_9ACTN|nr:class I SAM-dependent methyltransferase [Kineosporia corallincola]MBT0771484.1 class I SAM-dependent methyltransferase [Kineosporia corallincola]